MKASMKTALHCGFALSSLAACFLAAPADAGTVGTPVTPEISVASLSHAVGFSVAADASGNFVVAWRDDWAGTGTFYRLFAADGTPKGDAIPLPVAARSGGPTVAMSPAGTFAIAWPSADSSNTPSENVQLFAADGTAITAPMVVYTGATVASNPRIYSNFFISSTVAMAADGSFVVAWSGNTDYSWQGTGFFTGSNYYIQLRNYHADGTPSGGVVNVRSETKYFTDQLGSTSIAMAPNGSYAIIWSEKSSQKAKFYAAGGKAVSLAVTLPTWATATAVKNAPSYGPYVVPVSALTDSGDLLLAYDAPDPTTGADTVYLRRCSSHCRTQGTPIAVATRTTTVVDYGSISLVATATGGSIVSWGDGSNDTINAQAFSPADQVDGSVFSVGSDSSLSGFPPSGMHTALAGNGNLVVAWSNIKARAFQGS